MDFDQPNAEIGRKMANGRLLFLALHVIPNTHTSVYKEMCIHAYVTHVFSHVFVVQN